MKIRPFCLFATLLPVLAFAFSASTIAQERLPWQDGQNSQDKYQSRDGRSYNEPGETYDPSRHGNQGSQNYSQRGNSGGYDSGYDALRNNGRANQGAREPQPHSNRPGPGYQTRKGYGDNKGYEAPRQYDDQQRNEGQGRQPDYPRRDGPQQGYSQRGDANQGYPRQDDPRQGYQPPMAGGPGQAYAPPSGSRAPYGQNNRRPGKLPEYDATYSDDEIMAAGHHFFGKVTKSLAKVIAHVFKKSGRPNAYILGEEGGGALIAGLRYGEGTVYTKAGHRERVYWQGPSIGYDFGAEGAKTMILVYNLRDIDQIYKRYGGVDGSAYLVGGVGVTFQKRGRVVLAPIRSGLGVRLGANIGYLKYTRRPTWNPF